MRPALLLLLTSACAAEVPKEDAADKLPVSIEVSPSSASVNTGPDGGEAVQFTATVTWEDDSTEQVEVAEWSVSNQSAGSVDETGLFEPGTEGGGITWVTARLAGVEASATVSVRYLDEWIEGEADPSLFGDATERTAAELWVYPEDGVNIPRNTPAVEFQWSDDAMGEEAAVWAVRFVSDLTDILVYTDQSSWSADVDTWQSLASTNAGGTMEVYLFAATASGAVYEDEPISVQVNRMDAEGTIYYWSTSAAGFMAIPYGEGASDYLTQETTGYCMGCHVISSRGRIAFTYDGGNGPLGLVAMEDGTELQGHDGGIYGNFKAFSPDGLLLLTTYYGALLLYDGLSGEYLSEVSTGGTATHVDWDPDGSRVVLVISESHSSDWSFSGGRLATMEYVGDGQFDTPALLYDPGDGTNAYYPTFSPDGAWIAFNKSTGDSYDDSDATLYVMRADGSAEPVELASANRTTDITNSWPRWGPLPDDDVLWLAFSSKRDYGLYTSAIPQIWVAGFDPEEAAAGRDPSWPAFWLPNQDTSENNHIPVWAE